MAKQFTEMMQDLANSVKVSAKGKKVKTFSKKDFEDLFAAFLNETDYTTETIVSKAGEYTPEEIKPVAEFRKVFYQTLIDFGVDSQAAQAMLDGTYQFKKTPGAYAFTSEVLTNYLESKDFAFLPKQDLVGKLQMVDVEEDVKEFRVPGSDVKKKKKIKKHRKIKVKSSAPKWAKSDLK